MSTCNLPFELKPCPNECGKECGANVAGCPTYGRLTDSLQEQCQQNWHLLQYLHALPLDDIGVPEYYGTINRSLKSIKSPNLIYPVTDNVFIHILRNLDDIRDHYIPVEPTFCEGLDSLVEETEKRLVDAVGDDDTADEGKRLNSILDSLDKLIVVKRSARGNASRPASDDTKGRKRTLSNSNRKNPNKGKMVLDPTQYESLRYVLRRKLEGMGVLDPLIHDNNIEDISCSGLGNVFVEHRVFGGLTASIAYDTHDDLDKFVVELAETIKHPVTFRNPTVDATLPDGSRINIVYGTDVSKRGSNYTIRKFSPVPMSIMELIQLGTLSYEMAAYLSMICQEHMNLWVSGETASGKTTLMNALTTFIPPESKIVSIEDTPEVQIPHPNWIRGVSRGGSKISQATEVSMFDLLKAALRQRPNLIIVGEIRGEEGAIAFQAMQTGHGCMSTFHAATVTKLIQRLTGNPINVPKTYVDNLNVVVIAQHVRLPSGAGARRVTNISEIVGYDSVDDAFSFIDVFVWKPLEDAFDFRGYMSSYLLEEKIAPRRGIPREKRQKIYSQIKQRAEMLRRIHEAGITDFYEVHRMLNKAYREGHFR
jgi:flagellar protein FlaI